MEKSIRICCSNPSLVALRREQIATDAVRILVKKGYDRATIREIARACNMTMGMLYHYVGSKEDVLSLVMNHGVSRLAEACDKAFARLERVGASEALEHAITEYYRAVDKSQDLVLFTYQETKNLPREYQRSILDTSLRVVHGFEDLMAKGCMAGEFRATNVTLVAHKIVILGQMWALNRWFLRKHFTLEEYTTEHAASILEQLRERAGSP